jgi:hypothetical protein
VKRAVVARDGKRDAATRTVRRGPSSIRGTDACRVFDSFGGKFGRELTTLSLIGSASQQPTCESKRVDCGHSISRIEAELLQHVFGAALPLGDHNIAHVNQVVSTHLA